MTQLPKYTKQKMKGNIGEALVQYLLSKFCLVHKIDGSSDIGNDFICELIKDQYPTNLLFYVQVKHTEQRPRIGKKTIEYWKGSPIPIYLFWVRKEDRRIPRISEHEFNGIEKYYKRFTPLLHKSQDQSREKFKTFEEGEFKRDLIVDYARTQYIKGFTPVIRPRDFLNLEDKRRTRLGAYTLFIGDVIPGYREPILKSSWANMFSIAVLLFRNGDSKNLRLAFSTIRLAIELCPETDRELFSLLFEEMLKYEGKIKEKLKESQQLPPQ